GRGRRKTLAATRIADIFRRNELDLSTASVRCADPVGNPARENRCARTGIGFPAVVTPGHLQYERRLRRRRAIHDRGSLLVRRVHVIRSGERRRLSASVVAAATATFRANVLPEVDTERLNVIARGRWAAVGGAGGGRTRRIVRHRIGAAAAAAERERSQGRNHEEAGPAD